LDATRGEYYLHQYYSEQPDLNLRNPEVVARLKEVLTFWLDLGVDGFRVDAAGRFFECK
jgi:alpha-glucosidase